MDNLILHFIDHPDAPNPHITWRWRVAPSSAAKAGAESQVGTTTLDEFALLYRERFSEQEISVIISGQYLTYTRVAVTIKNQRQMLQALPFLVEEQVIGNIEDMHIATPERLVGDNLRIAIMDKALLEKFRLLFARHGLSVARMFGVPDLLSCAENELHILLHQQVAYVKGGDCCFECDDDSLETLLDVVRLEGLTTLVLSLDEQDKATQLLVNRLQVKLVTEALQVKIVPFSGDLLSHVFAESTQDFSGCLNLQQGEFSSASLASQSVMKYFPVAWMAFLCLLLQVGFNLSSGFYFHRYAGRLETNLSARYLALFPEETKVVDLEAQLKGKLNSTRMNAGDRTFPNVFATAVSVMNKTGDMKDIHLKQFRFDQESGELKMGLEISSVALLGKIKQGLIDLGYAVDIDSANEEGGVIKATLSMKHV